MNKKTSLLVLVLFALTANTALAKKLKLKDLKKDAKQECKAIDSNILKSLCLNSIREANSSKAVKAEIKRVVESKDPKQTLEQECDKLETKFMKRLCKESLNEV